MGKLNLTALVAGVLTLGIEIVVGRILAPFFGSSLHQWAALIGVVLLAYALGYAGFARIAGKGIAIPIALGGIYVLLLPFWIYGGVSSLLALSLPVASVLGALLAVGVPSLLWACVLPDLQRRSGPGEGSKVLAWSAVGNLIGAWGTAFLAVPFLGTRASVIGFGCLALILAGAWFKDGARATALALLAVGLGSATAALASASQAREPWDLMYESRSAGDAAPKRTRVSLQDSSYQSIGVWDEEQSGVTRRALALNGSLQFLWNSSEKLIDAGNRYDYYNYSTAAAYWTAHKPAREMLVLGLGGGLIPWQVHQFLPGVHVTCFELDPGVFEVARRELPLAQAGPVDVRIGDGRILLQHDDRKYDYILLDTFLNSYVPFHLTTREFFEAARSHLNPGGILVANFHTIFATSGLLPKLEATIRSVFPAVGAVDLPAGTTLVLASPDPAVLTARIRDGGQGAPDAIRALSENAAASLRAATEDSSGELVLTDDRNDTEQRLYETRRHIVVSRSL